MITITPVSKSCLVTIGEQVLQVSVNFHELRKGWPEVTVSGYGKYFRLFADEFYGRDTITLKAMMESMFGIDAEDAEEFGKFLFDNDYV
ncbi:hypothetical protein PS2_004 [Serratia phage PS2]|uniref:Uncharacterized protein n=1 Tax=Serratia phage PS2 TaxID=1481112 RepID=A0A023W609_9CAUD|nr:hypothetical protein FF83_gp004 [Serratia phage PS2]AHY25256.1 hypothetical protein PS2_004 [Serratia phage PS2]